MMLVTEAQTALIYIIGLAAIFTFAYLYDKRQEKRGERK